MGNLDIVKLGGSVITYKKKEPPQINKNSLSRIAKELNTRSEGKIVVIGGGSHGHQAAHKHGYGNPETPPKQLLDGIPNIRHNMTLLSLAVETALNNNGIPSVVVTPFCFVELKNNQIDSFPLENISRILEAGIVPILHGDVCLDIKRGASILSGDTIVAHLARNFKADRILIGTDVDGIFTANPKEDPNAILITEIDETNVQTVFERVGPSSTIDVTGGMQKKLEELISLTKHNQTEVIIFNLCVAGRLQSLLAQMPATCTRIQSTKK